MPHVPRISLVLAGVVLLGCHPGAGPAGTGPSAGPAAGRTAGAPTGGTTVEVRLICETKDPEVPCAFEPAEVTIAPGDTVRWVNEDATFHTVTSSDKPDVRVPNGLFDVVLDEAGETYHRTFPDAGTFPYYCQPHSAFMAGTVRVVEP